MVWGCLAANGVDNMNFIVDVMIADVGIDILRHNWKTRGEALVLKNFVRYRPPQDGFVNGSFVKDESTLYGYEWIFWYTQDKCFVRYGSDATIQNLTK